MKNLLLLLLLLPSVYSNTVNDAFDNVFSFLTPEITNYLIAFVLVYGVSLLALQKASFFGDSSNERNPIANLIAGALGFSASFSVYYIQFNLISYLAPWLIFLIVGVLSLMVWNVYKLFEEGGAGWITSMLASVALIVFGNALNRFYENYSYGSIISSPYVLETLYTVSPYLIILGIIIFFFSLIRAYQSLRGNSGGSGSFVNSGSSSGSPSGSSSGSPSGSSSGSPSGSSQTPNNYPPASVNNNIDVNLLAAQLIIALGQVSPIYNSNNIQNLLNMLQRQNIIDQLNLNGNEQIALRLQNLINENPNNDEIIAFVLQLLQVLGIDIESEGNLNRAIIVAPRLVTVGRGVLTQIKMNIQIPESRSYRIYSKHSSDILTIFSEGVSEANPDYAEFSNSTTFFLGVTPKDDTPLGETEVVLELLDGSRVIQQERIKLNIVEKEKSNVKKSKKSNINIKNFDLAKPKKILVGTYNINKEIGSMIPWITTEKFKDYGIILAPPRGSKLGPGSADFKTGKFTPDIPGQYIIRVIENIARRRLRNPLKKKNRVLDLILTVNPPSGTPPSGTPPSSNKIIKVSISNSVVGQPTKDLTKDIQAKLGSQGMTITDISKEVKFQLLDIPTGSKLIESDINNVTGQFTPDVDGEYEIRVLDSTGDKLPLKFSFNVDPVIDFSKPRLTQTHFHSEVEEGHKSKNLRTLIVENTTILQPLIDNLNSNSLSIDDLSLKGLNNTIELGVDEVFTANENKDFEYTFCLMCNGKEMLDEKNERIFFHFKVIDSSVVVAPISSTPEYSNMVADLDGNYKDVYSNFEKEFVQLQAYIKLNMDQIITHTEELKKDDKLNDDEKDELNQLENLEVEFKNKINDQIDNILKLNYITDLRNTKLVDKIKDIDQIYSKYFPRATKSAIRTKINEKITNHISQVHSKFTKLTKDKGTANLIDTY